MWCQSFEEGLANGQFASIKNSHVVLKLDSDFGRADFCEELSIERNNCYVLLMELAQANLRTDSDGKPFRPLSERVRFTNPKDLSKILGCIAVMEGK